MTGRGRSTVRSSGTDSTMLYRTTGMNVVVGTAKDGIRGLGQFRDRALVSPYRHLGDGWDRDVVEGSWMWVSGGH